MDVPHACECLREYQSLSTSAKRAEDISTSLRRSPKTKLTLRNFSPQNILLFTFIDYSPSSYSNYQFPLWADILGWCISFSCIAAVPVRAIWLILGKSGPIKAVSS